jgi:hypothetical protein
MGGANAARSYLDFARRVILRKLSDLVLYRLVEHSHFLGSREVFDAKILFQIIELFIKLFEILPELFYFFDQRRLVKTSP